MLSNSYTMIGILVSWEHWISYFLPLFIQYRIVFALKRSSQRVLVGAVCVLWKMTNGNLRWNWKNSLLCLHFPWKKGVKSTNITDCWCNINFSFSVIVVLSLTKNIEWHFYWSTISIWWFDSTKGKNDAIQKAFNV